MAQRASLPTRILAYVQDAVFATDLENRITFWGPSAERLFGISAPEALGRLFGELLPFRMAAPNDESDLLSSVAAGQAWRGEGIVMLRDGTELWLESTVSPLVVDGRVVGGVSVSRDTTVQRAEARARQAAERALRALSTLNRALVHASDETLLVQEACRIAVEVGGYRFAWVGFAEQDGRRTVRPVASVGSGAGYLDGAGITWADVPRGRGPAGAAIRTGRPDVLRDVGEPRSKPWRDALARYGFASVAALPLSTGTRPFGVLCVYAAEPDAFSPAELELLGEMANDLAYGIAARRTQAAHERAVAALRQSEERYRTVVDALAEGVVVQDADGTVLAANRAARAILGWPARGRPAAWRWPDDAIHADGTRMAPEEHPAARTLRSGRARRNVVFGLRRPAGTRWIAAHTDPLDIPGGGQGVVSALEDVTRFRAARAEEIFEVQLRVALAEAVHATPQDATLEARAHSICAHLATLPGVDLASVGAFEGDEELVILASHVAAGVAPRAGHRLAPETARYLRARAVQGSWAQYVRDIEGAGDWREELAALGTVGLAAGPIAGAGRLEGVLIVGTRNREFAATLVRKMPAVVAFSAASSALLAERLHGRREEIGRRRNIEQILAGRAFRPVFQVIVDLESRDPVGYEALTRFTSGQAPDHCFQDAWSVGLGAELELATLQAALEQAERLPAGRWLDLNISPRLLVEPARLGELLRAAGRPLVLEVTEHEPVANYPALRQAFASLGHDLRLAVDDAGAGAANFGHIVELRPDFVKLDLNLVRGVNANLGRQALVVAMRQFARSAGCRLVAEGVETESEAATLAQLGVEFGQGYLFGRPSAADTAADGA